MGDAVNKKEAGKKGGDSYWCRVENLRRIPGGGISSRNDAKILYGLITKLHLLEDFQSKLRIIKNDIKRNARASCGSN